jgi:hypothetical protein
MGAIAVGTTLNFANTLIRAALLLTREDMGRSRMRLGANPTIGVARVAIEGSVSPSLTNRATRGRGPVDPLAATADLWTKTNKRTEQGLGSSALVIITNFAEQSSHAGNALIGNLPQGLNERNVSPLGMLLDARLKTRGSEFLSGIIADRNKVKLQRRICGTDQLSSGGPALEGGSIGG